jgi:hypothetical protein
MWRVWGAGGEQMNLVGVFLRKRVQLGDLDLDRKKDYIWFSIISLESIEKIGRDSWEAILNTLTNIRFP